MSAAPLLKVMTVRLEVVRGPNHGEKFSFDKSRITVGRGPENDVVLSQDVKVSRQHIEVTIHGEQVIVKNLSDKNAMAVDGEMLGEKFVRPGASVRIGDSEIVVQFDRPEPKLALAPVSANVAANVGAQTQIYTNSSAAPATMPGIQPMPAQAIPKPQVAPKRQAARRPVQQGANRLPLYIAIVAIIGGAYYFSQDQIRKKREVKLRDSVTSKMAITTSETETEKLAKDIEKRGLDTIQYKLSQEQYLRGFRDYRQGQYLRAMEEFQASLSFYPNHELARKYYTLAKRRFDEQIQFNMIQGKRYYGIKNYRLCKSFYSNVVKMKKDANDPIYKEALQYFKECELKLQGKY